MTHTLSLSHPFDALADHYDSLFTNSVIGRAQRNAVWSVAQRIFRRGDSILELNCGSGEDALFLARAGINVLACDISPRIIAVAAERARAELPQGRIHFRVLANERICDLPADAPFDGVFSNFSGLNCVADLNPLARQLADRVLPGAPLLLCFSSHFCLWEIAWYLAHAQPRKALRRLVSGPKRARIGDRELAVYYPSVKSISRAFSPWFELQQHVAIGLTVPPSYIEPWARRHPKWIERLASLDGRLRSWSILRGCGDHVLLHLRRTAA